MLLTLLTIACQEVKEVNLNKDYPHYHRCNHYRTLGYEIDNECFRHIENPLFKIGTKVQIKDSRFSKNCTGVIVRHDWSTIKNIPFYHVNVTCGILEFIERLEEAELYESN